MDVGCCNSRRLSLCKTLGLSVFCINTNRCHTKAATIFNLSQWGVLQGYNITADVVFMYGHTVFDH